MAVLADVSRSSSIDRARLVRRGLWLGYATVTAVTGETIAALIAGLTAHSVALVGFGADSAIELLSAVAALWRLYADRLPTERERVERHTRRIIGVAFLALAAYIAADALHALLTHTLPRPSLLGISVAVASLVVMPVLSRAKRRVATGLSSRALRADATQTALCTYLSAIVLGGLVLNLTLGWWWADPVAALALTPIIVHEGIGSLRGASCDDGCC